MDSSELPHRCPKCQALVIDRRSPVCTSCRAGLPKEWIMSKEQIAKVKAIDKEASAEHVSMMKALNPGRDFDQPPILRLLQTDGNY